MHNLYTDLIKPGKKTRGDQSPLTQYVEIPASYPDKSFSMKICAQRTVGRRRLSSFSFPWSLVVRHRVSRLPLCDKQVPEEELVEIPGRIQYKLKSEKVENSRSHKSIEKYQSEKFYGVKYNCQSIKRIFMRKI